MRYKNVQIDSIGRDYIDFTNIEEGNLLLCATDELVEIVNDIRKKQGNKDLVGIDYDNEVYYDFYLIYNIVKKEISISAVCNYGEKDDKVWYELPMTTDEQINIMFILIECLVEEMFEVI